MAALVQSSLAIVPRSLSEGARSITKDHPADMDDISHYSLLVICELLILLLVAWKCVKESGVYWRTLACLHNDGQQYFLYPSETCARFKKNFLYAPVFGKIHNKEFQLSNAVTVGILPTRLQALFLILYLGTNVALCVATIDWSQSHIAVVTVLRRRSGNLAMANMVPLFVMAARNNLLIVAFGIPFDTFNLLHRYFGKLVVIEIAVHIVAWIALQVADERGWSGVAESFASDHKITFGLVAFSAMIAITTQAVSVIRHAFYETFKYLHILLVMLSVLGTWYHLHLKNLPEANILITVTALWGLDQIARIVRLLYRNVGYGGGKALVEALPGKAVRVTLDIVRPWAFRPGQHVYLYMPSIGLWTSHPFSVAWSQEVEGKVEKKWVAGSEQEVLTPRKMKISFVIQARTGFTASLVKRAEETTRGRFNTRCFAEGPYGGLVCLQSYGTALMFATGIGIVHHLPYVRDLISGYANWSVATRKITLVWVINNVAHLEWIRPWITEILAMKKSPDLLRMMIFLSQPHVDIRSPSTLVQTFSGRPNVKDLLDEAIEGQIGAMIVSVCACGAMSDDVRQAVRDRQYTRNIDFSEEAYSW